MAGFRGGDLDQLAPTGVLDERFVPLGAHLIPPQNSPMIRATVTNLECRYLIVGRKKGLHNESVEAVGQTQLG